MSVIIFVRQNLGLVNLKRDTAALLAPPCASAQWALFQKESYDKS